MIKCTLNDKTYTAEITGRALYEIDDALDMMRKVMRASEAATKDEPAPEDSKDVTLKGALDVLIDWFCLLFKNQFTPDDVLDYYPADRMMHDITLCLMAVQSQTTKVLNEFPTKAAQTEKPKKKTA